MKSFRPLAVIATGLVAALLAACSGSPAPTESPSASGSPSQPTDTTLNVGITADPARWDSSLVLTVAFPFTANIYDTLITYTDDMEPQPALATSWEIGEAQDSVTIHLREGVSFHGGGDFNAEAVAANLERFANSETGNQLFSGMATVKDWNVVDEHTLDVNFVSAIPEARVLDLLQTWAIGDPAVFDKYETEASGTGPFKLTAWSPGTSVTLEANENYWGGAPEVSTVEYTVIKDPDALVAALESGSVDLAYGISSLQARRLAANYGILEGFNGALINQWRMNPTHPPLDNANVRYAINAATDRTAIVETVYQGFGDVQGIVFPPVSAAFDQALSDEYATYDLEKAAEYLRTSGLPESEWKATVLVNSASQEMSQAAQILQASLAQIGFQLEVEVRDSGEYNERFLAGDFDLTLVAAGNAQKYPTRITANSIYRVANNPVGATEVFPDYVPAIDAANVAMTAAEQKAAFDHLNEVLLDAMWVSTVGTTVDLTAFNQNVSGVARTVDSMLNFSKAKIG